MTATKELQALLERVEAATGPDREIDEAVHAALLPEHEFGQLADAPEGVGCMMYRWPDGHQSSALRITASIDAALALVERVLTGWHWSLYDTDGLGRKNCQIEPPEYSSETFDGRGDTTPLAIIEALLKALIAQSEEYSK